jgi:ribonucleotide reductase class II
MTQTPEPPSLTYDPDLEAELDHRMSRYGLNPCVTADTWVHTEWGARQVWELVGRQHGTYVNGELFSTTAAGFFCTGRQPVWQLHTQSGYTLRLTGNHPLLKVTAQTPKAQYTAWTPAAQLQPGDRILLHNHRSIQPWAGTGTWEEGWLLGHWVSNGCLAIRHGAVRYGRETHNETAELALAICQQVKNQPIKSQGDHLLALAGRYGLSAHNSAITPQIERASYEFYRGFLRGLFAADGRIQGHHFPGVSIRLAPRQRLGLQAVQRMLLRLGIVANLYTYQGKYELVIAHDNVWEFQRLIGCQELHQSERLHTLLSNGQGNWQQERFTAVVTALIPQGEEPVYDCTVPGVACFDANGFVAHNCGEIIGTDFHCNLSEIHLNRIDPHDFEEQEKAFTAGALSVAALLNHRFVEPRFQRSREIDPIVGVSFTGLFDFFVHAFGKEWLQWWAAGRPRHEWGLILRQKEADYLQFWRDVVHRVVWDYCDRHGLRRPNRCTTVQPAGTKSLLTNASPGWHPPKAQRYIRRITFAKNDPVALACMDYGYSVVPGQSDKDEQGNLLHDPFDPRCSEWLVEIPVAVSWADIADAAGVDISQFSALAQFDFYMNVQQNYTTHNTSATIEFREHEIEALADRIYQAIQQDEGYISAALLSRFDALQTFPRLPFEPISKERYEQLMQEVLQRRKLADFGALLRRYDQPDWQLVPQVSACEGLTCELPAQPQSS